MMRGEKGGRCVPRGTTSTFLETGARHTLQLQPQPRNRVAQVVEQMMANGSYGRGA